MMPKSSLFAVKFDELSPDQIGTWKSFQCSDPRPSSPFLTYEFAAAAHAAGRDVNIVFCFATGKFLFLFPFEYLSRLDRTLAVATRVGNSMSDCMAALSKDGTAISPEQLLDYFSGIRFDHAPLASWKIDAIAENSVRIVRELTLDSSLEEYWDARSVLHKQRFSYLANRRRKLIKEFGNLSLREHGNLTPDAIEELISRKRSQYKNTHAIDAFADPRARKLLHKLATFGGEACRLHLTDLYAGNLWVASHLGIRNNELLHYWFPVYNEELRPYSPGLLLLQDIINSMPNNRIKYIDFGEGEADYKRIFATGAYDNFKRYMKQQSALGIIAEAAEGIKWRAQRLRSTANFSKID